MDKIEVEVDPKILNRMRAARLDESDLLCLTLVVMLVAEFGRPTPAQNAEIQARIREALSVADIAHPVAEALVTYIYALVGLGAPPFVDMSPCATLCASLPAGVQETVAGLIEHEISLLIDRGVDALVEIPAFQRARPDIQGLSAWNKLLVILALEKTRKAIRQRANRSQRKKN